MLLKNHWFLKIIFLLGFAVGLWHLEVAMRAIFVFRQNEPLSSWIAIISGPLTTLPAVIVSIFKRRLGGLLLIIGGSVSLIAFIAMVSNDPLVYEIMFKLFVMITLPMLLFGIIFSRMNKSEKGKRDQA